MKQIFTIILLLTCGICSGQNLVPNGDFEQYWGCPTSHSQIDSAKFWFNPKSGSGNGDPDYYNSCSNSIVIGVPDNVAGSQLAHSGNAYSGIIVYSPNSTLREYLEVPLTNSLIAGTCYHFEMYISSADFSRRNTDDIGVYFSDTIIQGSNNPLPLPVTPQINNPSGNFPNTVNWMQVAQNYTALGGENYIIIGNFKDDSTTTLVVQNINAPYIRAYFYIDDVSIIPCSTSGLNTNNNSTFNIFPNPITDKLTINTDNIELSEIILYDFSSRKLLQQTFTNTTTINTEQLANGMYLYEVRNRNGIIKNGKVIKQ